MNTKYTLVLSSCLIFAAVSIYTRQNYRLCFPPPNHINSFEDSSTEDMLALNFGIRRLFADLWFVRLMQYYGTPENGEPSVLNGDMTLEQFRLYGGGRYPRFFPMATHILQLDPYFKNAVLYSAACLAFNLAQPDRAISILNAALVYSPREWKFLTMLAAIGYSKAENPQKVAQSFMPLIKEDDCPVMIKQLAAFLNKKAENYANAYTIYLDIFRTSKEEHYVKNAEREMRKLELFFESRKRK